MEQVETFLKYAVSLISGRPVHTGCCLTIAADIVYILTDPYETGSIRLTVSHIAHIALPHCKCVVNKDTVLAESISTFGKQTVSLTCGNGTSTLCRACSQNRYR